MTRRFDGRDDEADPDLQTRLADTAAPKPLRDGLERFIHSLGAPPVSVVTGLRQRWEELVGPELAAETRPVEMVDGVLTVGCRDAVHAAQIGWMEAQIRRRYDRIFDGPPVTRVVTRVDR